MKLLQSKLFAALLGSVLFLLTTAFLATKGLAPPPPDEHAPESGHAASVNGPSWTFFNPELDQIVDELKGERATLATRDQQLTELAARLRAERAELDEALASIKKMREQVDQDVFRIKADEAGNLKKLAKMYAAMEPAGAARILRELDDVIIVKILTLTKEAETASILDQLARLGPAETRRAAAVSESLRAAASTKNSPKP